MPSLEPAFSSVNICCACDEKYAFPLAVSLYSMLENANKKRYYDIIILHSSIPSESREPLEKLGDHFPNCSVRFADMTKFRERVKNAEKSYITAETNYRLAVLGELFANYDRLIYISTAILLQREIFPNCSIQTLRAMLLAVRLLPMCACCVLRKRASLSTAYHTMLKTMPENLWA